MVASLLYFCITVLLYCGQPTVLLYYALLYGGQPTVLLYYCIVGQSTVSLYYCITAWWPAYCITILLYNCMVASLLYYFITVWWPAYCITVLLY